MRLTTAEEVDPDLLSLAMGFY